MILLDGKKLSQKILDELKDKIAKTKKQLRLAAVVVGKNPVTGKFIEQKKKTAANIGVAFRVYDFDEKISTNELRKRLADIVHEAKNTGVIIQLPLPAHINAQYILNAIPPEKDVDVLSARASGNFYVGKSEVLPPVVGAVKTFFEEYGIEYKGKNAVVVGAGKLVGKPVAAWLTNEGVVVSVVNEYTKDISEFTKKADIIISGAGKSKLITGEMVKDGAIVVDAGTSESEGKIVGDVDFDSVSAKASYITPVPGGVGPLTVAMLFKNLVTLAKAG
ncbi:MAG: bifunctional 5,10-methylenetetrahydrofolate dehydrogenase/5,10-methenyltetrahydrofolate cyclohydrolase [Candidatus Sungiibacteriota bacterium]